MKAGALFLVLALARASVLLGRDLEWSVWSVPSFLWQDVLIALCYWAFERSVRSTASSRVAYWTIILYTALNAPLWQVLSTPMTLALWRASGSAMSDSIFQYLTAKTMAPMALILAAGAVAPMLAAKLKQPTGRATLLLGFLLMGVGWLGARRCETHGLERSPFLAPFSSLAATLEFSGRREDWRKSLAAPGLRKFDAWRGMARGRNVVLIGLESTGARHLTRETAPHLSALSKNALVFENACAVYPESVKGLLSVLCSTVPAFQTKTEDYENLALPSLPLALPGYRSALFHSGRFMYLGMAELLRRRGFGALRDAGDIGGNRESSFGVDEDAAVANMLRWIDGADSGRPFFLHYLPIAGHHPYQSGSGPFPGDTEASRHRNAIFDGDRALGVFFEELKRRQLFENTLFVIYGDHGEAFGDHEANFGHTLQIYEENIHVPLVIAAPGLISGEHRTPAIASLLDIAPTLLDLLGAPAPPGFEGASALGGESRAALFFTDYSLGLLGIRDGDWKYIFNLESGRERFYDLRQDPGETKNMAAQNRSIAASFQRRVNGWAAEHRHRFNSMSRAAP